jgi:signal peptidase II
LSLDIPTDGRATRSSWLLLPALALFIVALDQYTKHLVQSNLRLFEVVQPIPALSHLFNITFVKNTGAAFGIFPNGSTLFALIAVVVAVAIAVYFRHIPNHEWVIKISLSMQLGGAIGNLIDRVRLGYVVDFFDFRMWPVFNFADTFIVVGVMLLAYRLLLFPESFVSVHEAPAAPVHDADTDQPLSVDIGQATDNET